MVHRVWSSVSRIGLICILVLLVSCKNEPAPGERDDILGTEKSLYSQGSEEIAIRDFFHLANRWVPLFLPAPGPTHI